MASHTIVLDDDQEAALADVVKRAQDPRVTIDSHLAVIVRIALKQFVDTHVQNQADRVHEAFLNASPLSRQAIALLLREGQPRIEVEQSPDGIISIKLFPPR